MCEGSGIALHSGTSVWTNTQANGERYGINQVHCNGWTSPSDRGIIGDATKKNSEWTLGNNGLTVSCQQQNALYCFQQQDVSYFVQ